MTHIAYDHSGLPMQSRHHDDGYEYHITGTTPLGDEIYSDYGGRWLKCISPGFHIQNTLLYRRPKAMINSVAQESEVIAIVRQRKRFDNNINELGRAVAWVRLNLDSFPEIPSILCYASGVTIGFGHISYGSKMMTAIHNVFAGKPAKKRLSSSTWSYELNDQDSGLSFAWYVFKQDVSQSDCEVIL